jgi:ribonuclease E
MSRQRLRTGVLEASTKACPHCEGTGLMRTASSAGLSALRIIEDEAARGRGDKIMLRAGREAAIYVLNRKRLELGEIEARYGVTIDVVIDEALEGARMSVESSGPRPVAQPRALAAPVFEEEDEDIVDADYEDVEEESEEREPREPRERAPRGGESRDEDGVRRRRRRRRGGRGRTRRDEGGEGLPEGEREAATASDEDRDVETAEMDRPERVEAEGEAPRPRRGRRGGRGRGRRSEGGEAPAETASDTVEPGSLPMVERPLAEEPPIAEIEPADADAKPKTRRRPRARKADAVEPVATPAVEPVAVEETEAKPVPSKAEGPKRRSRAKPKAAEDEAPEAPAKPAPKAKPALAVASETAAGADNDALGEESPDNPRSGWWQRTFG